MVRALSLGIPAAALLSACGPSSPGEAEPAFADGDWPVRIERPAVAPIDFERVVLVTIDTLRADHVSGYGYPRETTPCLDRLAARGALFTRAVSAISHTAPSHATMLTGLVPAVHAVLDNGGQLDPAAANLATAFRAAGFETAAFLNVQFLEGIAGSFDQVEVQARRRENGQTVILGGDQVVEAALSWLGGRERFFVWVHLYDPHHWKDVVLGKIPHPEPLWRGATPERFYDVIADLHGLPRFAPGEPFQVTWKVETQGGEEIQTPTEKDFLRCIDAYDALVLDADRSLERLYRGIEDPRLPGRTLWVVTSDHGEGLASHGVAGHGARIYQEQLRVPLVLHASDGSIAPRRIDELVGHVDLAPTLVETLGARVRSRAGLFDGRSLWPLVRGASGAWTARPAYSQRRPTPRAGSGPTELVSLQTERHKYILHEPGEDEFFDLLADPCELENRAGSDSREERELRAELEERLRLYRSAARGPAAGAPVPEEWARELRDLGYAR